MALTAAAIPLWLRLSLLAECGRRARQSLSTLEITGRSDQREEMRLHAALGASLTDASEMADAFAKVLVIAETLDDTEYRLRALRGLYFHGVWTNQFRSALSLAQRFHDLARSKSNYGDRLAGERMLGTVKYTLGDLGSARQHLEQALTPYPTTDRAQAAARFRDVIRFQNDGAVEARVFLAGVLWLQGLPDQAIRMAKSGLAEAQAIDHASSQCFALALGACPLSLWTGNIDAATNYTRSLIDLSTGYGLSHWAHYGAMYRRVIALKGGNVDRIEGLHQSEAHLQSRTGWTEFVDALAKAGQRAEGLAVLDKVMASVSDPGNFAPEWLRLRGEIKSCCLRHTPPLHESIGRALPASARCRAPTGRIIVGAARRNQPRPPVARSRPPGRRRQLPAADIRPHHVEGFDTADLIAAKHLFGMGCTTDHIRKPEQLGAPFKFHCHEPRALRSSADL